MATAGKAFRKHGTFIYQVAKTVADYGSNALAIAAMQRAGMSHVWVRVHSQTAYPAKEKKVISAFIDDAKAAGLAVAGWGWCQGADVKADAKLALRELQSFGLVDYVADIENGVSSAKWDNDEIVEFCTSVRAGVSGSFGITTFPLIDWHEPELMTAALPFVDMFNPQIYWHHFPNKKMVKQFRGPNGKVYSLSDAAEYADLCLDRWDALIKGSSTSLVITGQAYWGEGKPPFPEGDAEDKLDEFLARWSGYNRIIGLNWWHFGGGSAMSHRMIEAIVSAKLGDKPYER